MHHEIFEEGVVELGLKLGCLALGDDLSDRFLGFSVGEDLFIGLVHLLEASRLLLRTKIVQTKFVRMGPQSFFTVLLS